MARNGNLAANEEGPFGGKEEEIEQAQELFPNVDPAWIRTQLEAAPHVTVADVADIILRQQVDVPPRPPADRQQLIQQTKSLFPNIEDEWLENWVGSHLTENPDATFEQLAESILSSDTVPKKQKRKWDYSNTPSTSAVKQEAVWVSPVKKRRSKDASTSHSERPTGDPTEVVMKRFPSVFDRTEVDFEEVSLPSLRCVLAKAQQHYAVAWALLRRVGGEGIHQFEGNINARSDINNRFDQILLWKDGGAGYNVRFWFNLIQKRRSEKAMRMRRNRADPPSAALQAQFDLIRRLTEKRCDTKENEEDKTFDCPICCEEFEMQYASECGEAHLYCRNCIVGQATEVAYGQGQRAKTIAGLPCLEPTCQSYFSEEALDSALDENLKRRLGEYWREQNINAAQLSNFERCRYCNWGACVDVSKEANKVFSCLNENCKAEVCRQCRKDWDDEHIGKRCEELPSNIKEQLRIKLEEQLSEVIIRRCPRCRTPFDKIEGCNKMTCTCGHKMCYLCREDNIDYNHFCGHPSDPDTKVCDEECGKCMLWEKAIVRDTATLNELQKEAEKEQQKLFPSSDSSVDSRLPAKERQTSSSRTRRRLRIVPDLYDSDSDF